MKEEIKNHASLEGAGSGVSGVDCPLGDGPRESSSADNSDSSNADDLLGANIPKSKSATPARIVNVPELAALMGASVSRVHILLDSNRIIPDYQDGAGHAFFTPAHAARIASVHQAQASQSNRVRRVYDVEGPAVPAR